MINIEIVYALPEKATIIRCQVVTATTVIDAIIASGILHLHPLQIKQNDVGIYGKIVPLNQPLKEGDRVEIYRPLIISRPATKKR